MKGELLQMEWGQHQRWTGVFAKKRAFNYWSLVNTRAAYTWGKIRHSQLAQRSREVEISPFEGVYATAHTLSGSTTTLNVAGTRRIGVPARRTGIGQRNIVRYPLYCYGCGVIMGVFIMNMPLSADPALFKITRAARYTIRTCVGLTRQYLEHQTV